MAATEVAAERPESPEEAAELLRALGDAGRTVRVRGGGTKLGWGARGAPVEVEVSTGGLTRTLEHNEGDFTAVLQAGASLAEAQATFAAGGQMFAIDPPLGAGDAATLGGAVASADSGPLRHRYGGVRDLIVGMTVALSDGKLSTSGGRVIKNVAGYDIGKLFSGSMGTLGLIVSVSVRLHPLAEGNATAWGTAADPAVLARTTATLAALPIEADALDVAWDDRSGRLLVRFSGAAAERQAQAVLERLRAGGLEDVQATADDAALWDAQRAAQRSEAGAVIKVSALPADLGVVLGVARDAGARAVARAALGPVVADARGRPPARARRRPARRARAARLHAARRARRRTRARGHLARGRPGLAGRHAPRQGALRPRPDLQPGRLRGRDLTTLSCSTSPSTRPRATRRAGPGTSTTRPSCDLIRDCVHCGFCLPTCPSYKVFEEEMDSPRGRILLMRVGHEEGSEISPQFVTHLDRCLGCMACVTACPSGVQYDRLIERARPQLERQVDRAVVPARAAARRVRAVHAPGAAARPGAADGARAPLGHRPSGSPVSRSSGATRGCALMLALTPDVPAANAVHRLPRVTKPPRGRPRGRVAFMQGCVQRAGSPTSTRRRSASSPPRASRSTRARTPRCCGALTAALRARETSRSCWRAKTIAAYEDFDHVIANVAGCGSAMKDYGHLLADDPEWGERAKAFSAKVRDVHELLAEHEPRAERHPLALRVAYHDACHLAHAQGVRRPPRELLRSIPGLELLEPAEWELCCGSAGIYNVMQPEAAEELGRRKARNLEATGAEVIAAANPGCTMQIGAHLERGEIRVVHPMQLLDASLRGE